MLLRSSPLWLLVIFLANWAIYGQTIGFDFTYDDSRQIVDRPTVTDPEVSAATIFRPFIEASYPGNFYRPLTILTYRLNFLTSGLLASDYHLINLILQILSSWAMFLLVRTVLNGSALADNGDTAVAGVAALIFAVHPIHVEAVANVSGRAELLMTLFGVLSVVVFWKVLRSSGLARTLWILLSALLFLLACLSKESALALFGVFVVSPYCVSLQQRENPQTSWKRTYADAVPLLSIFALISIGAFLLRAGVVENPFEAYSDKTHYIMENPLLRLSFFERLVPATKVLADYLFLLFFPIQLSADYSRAEGDFWRETYSIEALPSVVVLIFYIFLLWRCRGDVRLFFGTWFFLAFSITANIISPIGTIMGERLAYLPSVGFCAFIASLVTPGGSRSNPFQRRAVWIGCGAVVVLFGIRAYDRTQVWRDNEILFTQTAIDAEPSPKAHRALGMYWYHRRHNRDEAEKHFRAALDRDSTEIESMRYLIDIFMYRKDFARAEYWSRKFLLLEPDDKKVNALLRGLLEFKEKLRQAPETEPLKQN